MTRGHLALAAERGELVPLPDFLERAWQIMRDVPEPFDGEAATGPTLFLLEGGGQHAPCGRRPRASLRVVPAART